MQRQLAQQLGVVFLGQFLRAAGAEDRLVVPAVAADMHAHVFHDPQHRHFHFLEHHDAFFGVDQRDVLRRGDHHRAGHRVVEVRPQRLLQHLHQRLAGHRPTPDHGVVVGHQVADGVGCQTIFHDRRHMGAVRRGRAAVFRTQHGRNRRTIDIGIQNAHLRPFRRQGQRQVYGSRRFTDAAFAGADGDNVFHAVDPGLVFHPLEGRDAVGQLPVDGLRAGDAQQFGAALLFQRFEGAAPDERHLQFNMDGIVQPGDMVQRLKGGEIMLQGWVLEIGQRPGDHRT